MNCYSDEKDNCRSTSHRDLPVSVSFFEEPMHRAECQLVVGDGAVLAAEGDEVGVGANATNPDPTRLVPNHAQFHALSSVKVTLLVSTT